MPDDKSEEELFLEAVNDFEQGRVKADKVVVEKEVAKPKKTKSILMTKIDLHGLTLKEAMLEIDKLAIAVLSNPQKTKIEIITGKGRHSQDGPVLASGIYDYVLKVFGNKIVSITESPTDAMLNGLPLRGSFEFEL